MTTMSAENCHTCPVATASRRAFLRDVGLAAAAALAVAALPAAALAESVVETSPRGRLGQRRLYAIPPGDSISVDTANDVIIARWQNRVYAFSLRCPHRGTRLEWRANEQRFFCPKHKARFNPDGAHDSGRASRDLDRHAITKEGSSIAVDLDTVFRADSDPSAWGAAVVVTG
jgi:nitrite reductase/ring-hydroxylating ferredoxin subunit